MRWYRNQIQSIYGLMSWNNIYNLRGYLSQKPPFKFPNKHQQFSHFKKSYVKNLIVHSNVMQRIARQKYYMKKWMQRNNWQDYDAWRKAVFNFRQFSSKIHDLNCNGDAKYPTLCSQLNFWFTCLFKWSLFSKFDRYRDIHLKPKFIENFEINQLKTIKKMLEI